MEVGIKYDKEKDDWSLLPVEAIEQMVQVLTMGARKYSRDNWKFVDDKRYEAATLRHFASWKKGEKIDPESGKSHLAHMMCNIAFLLSKELDKK